MATPTPVVQPSVLLLLTVGEAALLVRALESLQREARSSGARVGGVDELARLLDAQVTTLRQRSISAISDPTSASWGPCGNSAMLDVADAAAALEVGCRRVRQLAISGELPARRTGKRWQFRPEDVEAFRRSRS